MSLIDRQRIEAVKMLEAMGYAFRDGSWQGETAAALTQEADAMHALLVDRADRLEGHTAGSPEEAEFAAIAEVIENYEAVRWPNGRAERGKG